MPRRNDITKILVIGSGPIVIGQSAEFDYSGTQACKALKAEGYEVVLVNSNPATIMTDPELADRTYIEPLTPEYVEEIIRRESERMTDTAGRRSGKFALLPTVGGQTALNLAVDLADAGILEKYDVEMIGARLEAIKKAEDRLLFKDAMARIGLDVPRSALVNNIRDGAEFAAKIGFPVIIRPSFTLGGSGGGLAYNREELMDILGRGLDLSPVHECLIEESVLGWKEYELEVVRDLADNVIIICSIENMDPMGVHTGDSITVAPAQTLTDREYQSMRDAAIRIMREIGVETGGSNVQFAVNPATGRMTVIEMNPRVSRSSALASKATGFPIAKIAAKLAVGYTLDEIPNDITRKTPACFEPSIDYVVVKIPKWQFEKFPGADENLGPQMKSVGEVMALGRTFKEALMKALRSLDTGKRISSEVIEPKRLTQRLVTPQPERLNYIRYGLRSGLSVREIARMTSMDPWFLYQIKEVTEAIQKRTCCAKPNGWASPTHESPKYGVWIVWTVRSRSGICAFAMASPRSSRRWIPAPQNSTATLLICIPPTMRKMKRRRRRGGKSSFWAAAPTVSGRESSSTIAAAMLRSRSAKTTTKPSWLIAIRKRCRPITTPATACTSSP
jgi:carbamoyl-phosphate synthase large subunit